jgi:hypothetical protein
LILGDGITPDLVCLLPDRAAAQVARFSIFAS